VRIISLNAVSSKPVTVFSFNNFKNKFLPKERKTLDGVLILDYHKFDGFYQTRALDGLEIHALF